MSNFCDYKRTKNFICNSRTLSWVAHRSVQPSLEGVARKNLRGWAKQKQVHTQEKSNSTSRPPDSSKPVRYISKPLGELNCPHFGECSGCSINDDLGAPPIYFKARKFFAERGLTNFPSILGPIHGWRCRAKLAVRGSPGKPLIGLYKKGSHDVVAIPKCVVHHPRINQAVELITQVARQLRVEPYDEAAGTGHLRYLQLTAVSSDSQLLPAEQDPTAQLQVVLVWGTSQEDGPGAEAARKLSQALWACGAAAKPTTAMARGGSSSTRATEHAAAAAKPAAASKQGPACRAQVAGPAQSAATLSQLPLLHSIWVNFQPQQGNKILGDQWALMHGDVDVWQNFGGMLTCLAPGSFVQANFGAMQRALSAIHGHVPAGARITELHSGVGAIGLSLFAASSETLEGAPAALRCVEINPACEAPFLKSRARLLHVLQGQVAAAAARKGHAPLPGAATTASSVGAGGSSSKSSSSGSRAGIIGIDPSGSASLSTLPEIELVVAAAGSDPGNFLQGSDVVIVDPPRKGLEASVLQALCNQTMQPPSHQHALSKQVPQMPSSMISLAHPTLPANKLPTNSTSSTSTSTGNSTGNSNKGDISGSSSSLGAAVHSCRTGSCPHTLVYLSCGFEALQRDCDVLLAGGWRLHEASAFLFFPGTDAIETLVVFKRPRA